MAEKNIILCVGSRKDPHVNEVQAYLRGINSDLKLILFNPLCVNHFIEITVDNNSKPTCVFTTGEHRTVAESVRSIWYRWFPRKFSDGDGIDDAFIAKDFALEEWKNVMQSVDVFLPRALWMNKLKHVEQIKSKGYQLHLAQACGMKIPLTKITNDGASAYSLFSCGRHTPDRIVSKPLTPLHIPPTKRVRPREITSNYPIEASSTISIFPGIFQELIESDVGLCVIVVNDKIFSARTRPKKSFGPPQTDKNAIYEEDSAIYGACKIPEYLEKSILNFHQKAGLVFAVYDFLEDDAGECIFLDCNPCGPWLTLEYTTGLQVTKAVAQTLAGATDHQNNQALKQFENL